MTIKELLKVLSQAPSMDGEVWIYEIKDGETTGDYTTKIRWKFDDRGDLELLPSENGK